MRIQKVRGAKKVVKVTLKPKAQASRGIKVGMVLLMPYGLKVSTSYPQITWSRVVMTEYTFRALVKSDVRKSLRLK